MCTYVLLLFLSLCLDTSMLIGKIDDRDYLGVVLNSSIHVQSKLNLVKLGWQYLNWYGHRLAPKNV